MLQHEWREVMCRFCADEMQQATMGNLSHEVFFFFLPCAVGWIHLTMCVRLFHHMRITQTGKALVATGRAHFPRPYGQRSNTCAFLHITVFSHENVAKPALPRWLNASPPSLNCNCSGQSRLNRTELKLVPRRNLDRLVLSSTLRSTLRLKLGSSPSGPAGEVSLLRYDSAHFPPISLCGTPNCFCSLHSSSSTLWDWKREGQVREKIGRKIRASLAPVCYGIATIVSMLGAILC